MGYIMGILSILFGLTQNYPAHADISNVIVLDVRTPQEYQEVHVKDAINMDFMNSDFKTQIEKLDKSKNYKVYCRSGNRSGQAVRLMKSLGFKNVENIGSVSQAAKNLNRECEGKSLC